MSEWWTYRLSDFPMFSAETCHQLIARYNRDLWPAPFAVVPVGLAIEVVGVVRTFGSGGWPNRSSRPYIFMRS